MRRHRVLFRATAALTAAVLALPAGAPVVFAQPAPSTDPAPQQAVDPPARVGRLTALRGTVSLHGPEDTQWSAAAANYPVASGYGLWTDTGAEATLEVAANRVALASRTAFELTTLDERALQATLGQGEAYLRLRRLEPNEAWSVQTPRGTVALNGPGRYVIAAGTTEAPTLITVLDGAAGIEGPGVDLRVEAGQTATLTGTDSFQGEVGPAQRDPFVEAMLARERPPPAPAIPPPPAVAAMPGGDELAAYGTWSQAPDYGRVWYPQVAPGWVPSRDGHWAYVAPWGWTWVDNAPWGFAPFHYGRWVATGDRWGWVPGVAADPVYRPVYAPALVTFFGVGAGVAVGVGLGAALAAGSIGWCPLGPREPYRPWFHASDRYVREVNVTHVTNVTTVNRNVTINNFTNRAAATVVPASVLQASRPVAQFAEPVRAQTLATARPVFGQQPVRPTAATAGVTQAAARSLNLTPVPGAPRRPAPGPAIRAQALQAGPGQPLATQPPGAEQAQTPNRPTPLGGRTTALPPLAGQPNRAAAFGNTTSATLPPGAVGHEPNGTPRLPSLAAPGRSTPAVSPANPLSGSPSPLTGPNTVQSVPPVIRPGTRAGQAPVSGAASPGIAAQGIPGQGGSIGAQPLPSAATPTARGGVPTVIPGTPPSGSARPNAVAAGPNAGSRLPLAAPGAPPILPPGSGGTPQGPRPNLAEIRGANPAAPPHAHSAQALAQPGPVSGTVVVRPTPAPVTPPVSQIHPAVPQQAPAFRPPQAQPAASSPQFHAAAPAPNAQVHAPAPAAVPPPQFRAPPALAPQFHAPPPAPQVHAPAPMQVPQVHAPPPSPPPQFHAPAPAAAPQASPQQRHQRRPGEP